jgi:hypothetical protein
LAGFFDRHFIMGAFLTDISGAVFFRNARLVYLLRLFLFENGGLPALEAI